MKKRKPKGSTITGHEIRVLRSALGLEPLAFAMALGAHSSTVYAWESRSEFRCYEMHHELLRAAIARVALLSDADAARAGRKILQGVLAGGMIGGMGALLDFVRENGGTE